MANVLELILKATDQVSGTLKNIEQAGGSTASAITSRWKEIGAASAAAAAGIEVMARKVGELNEATDKLSTISGVTSTELNEIARSVAGAGDSIGEVLDVMTSGAKQGLESGQALEQYAAFWDLVGDAAGENSAALADASVSLAGFGITAENVGDSAGAFGYILNETSLSISEFLEICAKAGPEVEGLGLSVDDMAIIMDSLEERGITGRKAISAISEAAELANGDVAAFEQALGLTTGTLATAEQATGTYTTKLNDMAVAQEENLTLTQRMSSAFGEITYKYGDMIQTASNFAPALAAVGPVLGVMESLRTSTVLLEASMVMANAQAMGMSGTMAVLTGTLNGASLAAGTAGLAGSVLLVGGALAVLIGILAAHEYQVGKSEEAWDRLAKSGENLEKVKRNLQSTNDDLAESTDRVTEAQNDLGQSAGDVGNTLNALGGAYTEDGTLIRDYTANVTAATQAYSDHVAKFLTDTEKKQIALELAIEEYERTGDASKMMAIAAEQASAQEQAALDRAIQKFRETGDASELMALMHRNAMNTMAGATDTAVGTMIGKLQAFVRTATGVWQGLQEIVTQGSSYLWYNETSGLWEQMVPAADGQGYVPIGSPLADQTTGGGGSSDPSISPSGLPWKVNDDGTYSTTYDNAGNYVGPGSIYAQQAASSGSGSGTSGTGTGTGGYYAPSGNSPTGSVVTYLVASGDGTYQAIDTAGSSDQINNLTPEQFWEYVAQGFPVYSSGNMAGSSWFPGVEITEEYQDALASMNDAQQEATNAIEDSTDATQDLANAANSLMNAQQSAANATQTAANATQTATNAAGGFTTATSIATAAQSYMASVLGGTTLAAQQSTSAVGEMNTNVATGVAATANNVAGAYGTMGYTAGLSALQISGITSDLFGSIQSQAQAALAALTGDSSSGGCTGAGCGSVTPGSGLPDFGDSWTIGTDIDWSGYGLGDWGTGGGLPALPDSPFPWLAEGGDIEEEGGVVVGDAGPEILHLPKGARVSPLPKNRQDAEARKAEHAAAREAKRAALEAERQARLAEQEARRKENEWIDKIANKILNRIGSGRGGGGGDVHLHGIFIADKSGLMRLQKELENVKILEDTRRGRRVTA